EDEASHTSFRSPRKSRIAWAPSPSSTMRVSPRFGGAPRLPTAVREPASPTWSAARPSWPIPSRLCGLALRARLPLRAGSPRSVGPARERATKRLGAPLRAHRDDDDLSPARGVALAQPLLNRVHVEGVERELAGAVEALALRVDAPGRSGLGHLLHADSDLHI